MNSLSIGIDPKFSGIWYFGITHYNWIIAIKLGLTWLIKVHGRSHIELPVFCFERKIYTNSHEKAEVFLSLCCVFTCQITCLFKRIQHSVCLFASCVSCHDNAEFIDSTWHFHYDSARLN